MDVRIGVTYTAKEIEVDLGDADAEEVKASVDAAISGQSTLWLTDRRGRQIGVPADKLAYVDIGSPGDGRRIGFGN